MALAVQTLEGMEQAPGAVPGGQSGLAAQEQRTAATAGLAPGVLAVLGAAFGARRVLAGVRR